MSSKFRVSPDRRLHWPGGVARCALGRKDRIAASLKREGDGATPVGTWTLREVLYRADRMPAPPTGLPVTGISRDVGWCDDPANETYNRPVRLPFAGSHEKLWREDGVYDLIVPLGYNDDPVIAGRGSAIFLHVAREDYAPTEGCVALSLPDLLAMLAHAGPGDVLEIEPPGSAT
jgi:L,D-peptidoglycan transpeptidase YkuD (ErfK/YbiS/YcfS/YnhG family)